MLCDPVNEVTDRGLAASDLFRDLWLRQFAVTLDFGENVFPLHVHIM